MRKGHFYKAFKLECGPGGDIIYTPTGSERNLKKSLGILLKHAFNSEKPIKEGRPELEKLLDDMQWDFEEGVSDYIPNFQAMYKARKLLNRKYLINAKTGEEAKIIYGYLNNLTKSKKSYGNDGFLIGAVGSLLYYLIGQPLLFGPEITSGWQALEGFLMFLAPMVAGTAMGIYHDKKANELREFIKDKVSIILHEFTHAGRYYETSLDYNGKKLPI